MSTGTPPISFVGLNNGCPAREMAGELTDDDDDDDADPVGIIDFVGDAFNETALADGRLMYADDGDDVEDELVASVDDE